jgi:flavin-dependent dehydrogenase
MAATDKVDVLVVGAGPSGAIASALLVQRGYNVRVLEKETFPRFSIGESLLPQCMQYIEEAGMLAAVHAGEFQYKNGAAFLHRGEYTEIDFREKFTAGWGTTYQVERSRFDKILADEAERMGADIRYQHEITGVDVSGTQAVVSYGNPEGEAQSLEAKFVLDGSGFGRVLPRLLDLNKPSTFPVRQAIFTHVHDHIDADWFDRNKILITVHPTDRDVWFWLIPFGDGKASVGVVAPKVFIERYSGSDEEKLRAIIADETQLDALLAKAEFDFPVREISGYSANVTSLHGPHFALLGNAGEFLDPVFSSGVTIAMRSASMAAALLDRQLQGEIVDWDESFSKPLMIGVDSFRAFVTGWYDQRLQDVIFHKEPQSGIKGMIASILAGYAWDEENPYVRESDRRLSVLAKVCRST